MSLLTLTFLGAASPDDWNVDSGLSARFAFCYGSAPVVSTIVLPTAGLPVIPTTATVSSVVGTFVGVAVDSGFRQPQVAWKDTLGNVTSTVAGPAFLDFLDPNHFAPYNAPLTPPIGGWTPAKVNGGSLGLTMDDQRGDYPARCRWRITDDSSNPLLSAVVTFTLAAPTAATVAANNLTTTGATLNGTVDALQANADFPVTVHFEWGLTAGYGNSTPNQVITGGSQAVTADITGLAAATTYHFRVVAINADNTVGSTDATFATVGAAATGSPIRMSNISPRRRY